MSEFRIALFPPLTKAHYHYPSINLQELDFERIFQLYPEEIDIRYFLDKEMFSYYPSSIVTTLNDINFELDFIRSRTSHDMTLSGYTILQMVFASDRVDFYDPIEHSLSEPGGIILGTCAAIDLEASFRETLDALWESIQSRLSN